VTRRRKIILMAAILVGLPPLVIAVVLAALFMDESPPKDDDLRLPPSSLAAEENAFTFFEEAARNTVLPKSTADQTPITPWEETKGLLRIERMASGKGWDADLADRVLAENQECLSLVHKGLACRGCRAPIPVRPLETPEIVPLVGTMGVLIPIQAQRLHRDGRDPEAFALALECMEVGDRLEHASGTIVAWLCGATIKGTGGDVVRLLLKDGTLDAAALKRRAAEVGRYRNAGEGMAAGYRAEYAMWCSVVDNDGSTFLENARGKGGEFIPFLLRKNTTKGLMAESLRPLIQDAAKCATDRGPQPGTPPWKEKSLVSTNAMGRLFCRSMTAPFRGVHDLKCNENSFISAVQTLLALKAHKLEKGRLPETLADLVPEYLPAVPLDDFDGKAIRYDPRKRIVYTIGKDLKDDGGTSREEWDAQERQRKEDLGEAYHPKDFDAELWNFPDPSFPIEF